MKVLTVGTFDLLHPGHLELLTQCRELASSPGDKVHVGVNTDEFVLRYRGTPPLMGHEARMELLSALRVVDHVWPNDQPDGSMLRLLEFVQPRYLVIGSDWLRRDYLGQIGVTADELDARRISLVYSSRPLDGPSSTRLKAVPA